MPQQRGQLTSLSFEVALAESCAATVALGALGASVKKLRIGRTYPYRCTLDVEHSLSQEQLDAVDCSVLAAADLCGLSQHPEIVQRHAELSKRLGDRFPAARALAATLVPRRKYLGVLASYTRTMSRR